jgi:HPt (histidine-containing phosphotransfer) domain-containing protein
MASGKSSSERPVLEVLRRRIRQFEKVAKTKTLQKGHQSKPIVAALVKELRELRSKLTSALAEKHPQAMATSVLRTLFRRIKILRKKYDHIIRMEELLASGETLKKEQEEVLRSKPIVVALIKELSELTSRLISALAEELRQICDLKPNQSDGFLNTDDQIEDLLLLLNLACARSQSEFPVVMLTRRYERGCLTFDYMTDEEVHLLSENDLNFLSFLGPLATSQPVNEIGPHKSAFEATATYAGWNDKLKKIMSSEDSTVPSDSTKVDIATANDEKICRHAYLKGDGGSKKKTRTEVHAQSSTPKIKGRFDPSRCAFNYVNYRRSETSEWITNKAAAYWDSLGDKCMYFILTYSYTCSSDVNM